MSRHADVLVVGGGVIGCAVAWSLAREGVSVLVLEQREVAAEASGAAAGMLLPYGESAAPGVFQRWGCEALARYPALCDELREQSGIDPELERCGAYYLAGSAAERAALHERCAAFPDAGFEWLDARDAGAALPGLAPELRGALFSPSESHVRSPQLARAYAGAAESLGARIERGAAVRRVVRGPQGRVGVETRDGVRSAGAVVICAGAWGSDLVPDALPVEPVRGQIVSLENPSPPLRGMALRGSTYLVPKRDGRLVIGATEESVGFDRRVTPEGVEGLLADARRLFPGLSRTGFLGAWAGLRPATPDRLPVVGPLPDAPGLFVAGGHFRNGVLLSAVTGSLIAAQILGKSVSRELRAFRPERFEASSRGRQARPGALE